MTTHISGDFKHRGKLVGICENLSNTNQGLGYIAKMGYTYVHYLPLQDFYSVDETRDQYNWGYDPENYFIVEGSYCTNLDNPESRILEFQKFVQTHHHGAWSCDGCGIQSHL